MLLIKTTLMTSGIHGVGVFAVERIKAGTEVWRFQPGFDLDKTVAEVEGLPLHAQEWIKSFGYLDHHFNRYILSFDNARFINHHENANIRADYSLNPYGVGVTVRDIQESEELTIDYLEIEHSSWLKKAVL